MPGAHARKKGKKHNPGKHTPIVSKKQRGLFGAELARRRAGKARRMPGITTAELESHLREAGGKRLPQRSGKGRSNPPRVNRKKRR